MKTKTVSRLGIAALFLILLTFIFCYSAFASTITYYPNGRIESILLDASDAAGNIYYHYLDEAFDHNGDGVIDEDENYGRINKSYRNVATSSGVKSHRYFYVSGTNRLSSVRGYSDTNWTTLIETYTYYNNTDNRMKSKTLVLPDAAGHIYYHYIDEDWRGSGFGRVDKTKRQTAINGELSHRYFYYTDADGRLRQKRAYSDNAWTTLFATYTYYNNAANHISDKSLVSPDEGGNIYYHYIDESWQGLGIGRVDKSKRQAALGGELSHTYAYYADADGRLMEKKAYSDGRWTTLIATYKYYNDSANRVYSKTLPDGTRYKYYNEDFNQSGIGRLRETRLSSGTRYVNTAYWTGTANAAVVEEYDAAGTLQHVYNNYYDVSTRLEGFKKYDNAGVLTETDYWFYSVVYYKVGQTWYSANNVMVKNDMTSNQWYLYELADAADPWSGSLLATSSTQFTLYDSEDGSIIAYPDISVPLPEDMPWSDPEDEGGLALLSQDNKDDYNDGRSCSAKNLGTSGKRGNRSLYDQALDDKILAETLKAAQTAPESKYSYTHELAYSIDRLNPSSLLKPLEEK